MNDPNTRERALRHILTRKNARIRALTAFGAQCLRRLELHRVRLARLEIELAAIELEAVKRERAA